MITAIFIALWLIIGFLSIVYWWTDKLPLTIGDLAIVGLASILGLWAFVFFALPILIGSQWPTKFSGDKIVFKAKDKRTKSMRIGRYERYTNDEWPGEKNTALTQVIETEEKLKSIYKEVEKKRPINQQSSS